MKQYEKCSILKFVPITYSSSTSMMWDTIPLVDCLRCGNPLLAKEIKAKQHHCAPCKRLVEAAEHQERVSDAIHRANVRGGL